MLRVATRWTAGPGTPYYTNFYFDGDTVGEATAAHSAVVGLWTAFNAALNVSLDLTVEADVPVINPATGETVSVFTETDEELGFINGGDPLPWSNQALIRWRTGTYMGGREIRGRTFIPGLAETNATAGVLNASALTFLEDTAEDFVTGADALAAGGLVVWSPTNGHASLVANWSVWEQLAVLRSRRPL